MALLTPARADQDPVLMHAYRKFVQDEMDKRGWTAAELSRASGLSRQNLSRILNDDRGVLQRRPEPPTISALAQAFRYSEDYVLSYVAEAMGFSSERVRIADASALSNEELLRVLAERLSGGGVHGHGSTHTGDRSTPTAPDSQAAGGGAVEDPAQPDGITSTAGTREPDTSRGVPDAGQLVEGLDIPDANDRPWEQDEYGLAAKRGRNRGREARRQQDLAAEDGGA